MISSGCWAKRGVDKRTKIRYVSKLPRPIKNTTKKKRSQILKDKKIEYFLNCVNLTADCMCNVFIALVLFRKAYNIFPFILLPSLKPKTKTKTKTKTKPIKKAKRQKKKKKKLQITQDDVNANIQDESEWYVENSVRLY